MSQDIPGPTGVVRRRRRLSDEQTEQRMLQAALAMVNDAGLTVSLDHISFEDVIRDAGVSRSAVYRRWPYKDLFFSDLLKELARGSSPAIAGDNLEASRSIRRIILDHLDWLKEPELRRALVAEVLRQGVLSEFEIFQESAAWRTYFALHATFLSLSDGDLRNDVRSALTTSEQDLTTRMAAAYEWIAGLIGLRLRPELDASFETVVNLANAVIRGLVIMAPSSPDIATQRIRANPFGAPEPAEWSRPALGVAGIVLTFLESDPAVEWDDKRMAQVRQSLESHDWPRRDRAVG